MKIQDIALIGNEGSAGFKLCYDNKFGAYILTVTEPKSFFPLYIEDEAGMYRVMKNRSGKLQMCK